MAGLFLSGLENAKRPYNTQPFMPGSQGKFLIFEQSPFISCGQPHEPDILIPVMIAVSCVYKLQIKQGSDKYLLNDQMIKKQLQRLLDEIESEYRYTSKMTGKRSLDPKVKTALGNVPRNKFVPDGSIEFAFENRPLPIGHGQTISQPYIVALMTDLLELKADDTVLEIGTGSGYQASILSQLCKQVYSIEYVTGLADLARARLQKLGYDNIETKAGNGYDGWPEHAPYDGIIVTAAASHIPRPLIEQLKPGGRMVIPVGQPYSYQELMLVEKTEDGELDIRQVLGVAFVPFRGEHE